MKKYFLTLCTLGLGMLTALWVCAQSETTAAEKAEKNPGDQLIEFLQNLPSKYEAGIESKMYNYDETSTYYKIKKATPNLFFGFSTNFSYINTGNLDKVNQFHIICNDDNEYWNLNDKSLTLWTNKGEKIELKNTAVQEILRSHQSVESLFSIIRGLKNAFWIDINHFSITNSQGEIIESSSFVRDNEGHILKQILTITPQPLNTYNGEKMWDIGEIYEYSYDKNFEVPFFPKIVTQYKIRKVLSNGNESFRTNTFRTKTFHYLNLNPKFDNNSFSLNQFDTNLFPKTRYWISGTNVLYVDTNAQQILRVMEAGESEQLRAMRERTQSKYRGIYIVLVIISLIVFFFLIIRKSKSN